MRKPLAAVLLVLSLAAVSVGYLKFLEIALPRNGFRFQSEWEDSTFATEYKELAWKDSDFRDGWSVVWTAGQTNDSSGFRTEGGVGVLYATFSGYNYEEERGVSGIMIQKSVGNINTTIFPYLTINHIESTSDSSLSFSFGITTSADVWLDSGLRHVSTSSMNLQVDLRKIHNGTINSVSIRFTNGYDPNYNGGIQKTFIQEIAISQGYPKWTLAYDKPINADVSSQDGILKIYGSGNISIGTTVTAQRFVDEPVNLTKLKYLQVSIKTSAIDVAARIVVWTDHSRSYVVLLKTYNDNDWHTDVVDLSFFGIKNSLLYAIELGWSQIYEGSTSVAFYGQLSFNTLEAVN